MLYNYYKQPDDKSVAIKISQFYSDIVGSSVDTDSRTSWLGRSSHRSPLAPDKMIEKDAPNRSGTTMKNGRMIQCAMLPKQALLKRFCWRHATITIHFSKIYFGPMLWIPLQLLSKSSKARPHPRCAWFGCWRLFHQAPAITLAPLVVSINTFGDVNNWFSYVLLLTWEK